MSARSLATRPILSVSSRFARDLCPITVTRIPAAPWTGSQIATKPAIAHRTRLHRLSATPMSCHQAVYDVEHAAGDQAAADDKCAGNRDRHRIAETEPPV